MCNPDSGGGTDMEHVRALLRRHGARVIDDETEADRIVVCGGDGTLGRAAELAARLGVPLAVMPAGTANDFARALELPVDLEAAARLAATGIETRSLELGRIDGRPFVNVASAGLAPSAARRAEPLKGLLGPLAYPVAALMAGVLDRPVRCAAITARGEVFSGAAWQVIVACTGAFGGGAEIDAADPTDGRLDLLVLPAGRRLMLGRHALAMRRGSLAEAPGVVHARDDSITLRVPTPTAFNVDGEVVEATGDVELRIDPRTYAVVVGVTRPA